MGKKDAVQAVGESLLKKIDIPQAAPATVEKIAEPVANVATAIVQNNDATSQKSNEDEGMQLANDSDESGVMQMGGGDDDESSVVPGN